jgi:predicted NACHT family NTPase
MGVIETIASEIIKRVLSQSKIRSSAWKPERLRSHLIEVVNWSRRVEFLGLAEARNPDSDTIAMFSAIPRRFRGNEVSIAFTDEEELIAAEGCIVLLGDPGAGKTTTLKRIARAILDVPTSLKDTAEYPLMVRLRELAHELLLEESLAQAIGIRTIRKSSPPNDTFQVFSGERLAIAFSAKLQMTQAPYFCLMD